MRNRFEVTMAGVFGDRINCRADFQKELDSVRMLCESVVRRLPNERLLESVQRQLEALQTWTANGRIPTPDERNQIIMGIQMHREYEMTEDKDIYQLKGRTGALNNYVKHWPNDTTAADPHNGAYI
jgi:hypothetical protein